MKATIRIELTTGSVIKAELTSKCETSFIVDALKKAVTDCGAKISEMSVIEETDVTFRYFTERDKRI